MPCPHFHYMKEFVSNVQPLCSTESHRPKQHKSKLYLLLLFLSLFHLFAVLDVNDGTPTFFPNVYNISLEESVPRDYVLVRLNCTDNDSGLNAELSYFITGQSSKSLKIVICFPDP